MSHIGRNTELQLNAPRGLLPFGPAQILQSRAQSRYVRRLRWLVSVKRNDGGVHFVACVKWAVTKTIPLVVNSLYCYKTNDLIVLIIGRKIRNSSTAAGSLYFQCLLIRSTHLYSSEVPVTLRDTVPRHGSLPKRRIPDLPVACRDA